MNACFSSLARLEPRTPDRSAGEQRFVEVTDRTLDAERSPTRELRTCDGSNLRDLRTTQSHILKLSPTLHSNQVTAVFLKTGHRQVHEERVMRDGLGMLVCGWRLFLGPEKSADGDKINLPKPKVQSRLSVSCCIFPFTVVSGNCAHVRKHRVYGEFGITGMPKSQLKVVCRKTQESIPASTPENCRLKTAKN